MRSSFKKMTGVKNPFSYITRVSFSILSGCGRNLSPLDS
jgi:hypothetical protein